MYDGQQITFRMYALMSADYLLHVCFLMILLGGLLPITQIMDAADLTTSTGTS